MSSVRAPSSSANSARARSLSVKKSAERIRQGWRLRPIPSAPTSAARFSSGDM
jgi:hypothetical protein